MKNKAVNAAFINYLLLIGIGVIWGSQFMFNKWAISTIPPTTMAASRCLIGALTLSLLIRQPRNQGFFRSFSQTFHGPWLFYLIIGLAEAAVPFFLVAWGQGQIDSGIAAILMGTIPMFTIIMVKLFIPSERLGLGSLFSVIVGFVGILTLIGPTSISGVPNSLVGELAVLCAALSFSISLILIQRLPNLSPIVTSRNILVGACIFLVPAAIIIDHPWNIHTSALSILSLFILGVFCGGIVYVMYVVLVMRVGATFTSLNNYLVPIVGAMIGIVFLGETFKWNVIVALVLIMSAMFLNQLRPKRKIS
jgi:drug/metabolite transporter (DMT)-like permease